MALWVYMVRLVHYFCLSSGRRMMNTFSRLHSWHLLVLLLYGLVLVVCSILLCTFSHHLLICRLACSALCCYPCSGSWSRFMEIESFRLDKKYQYFLPTFYTQHSGNFARPPTRESKVCFAASIWISSTNNNISILYGSKTNNKHTLQAWQPGCVTTSVTQHAGNHHTGVKKFMNIFFLLDYTRLRVLCHHGDIKLYKYSWSGCEVFCIDGN